MGAWMEKGSGRAGAIPPRHLSTRSCAGPSEDVLSIAIRNAAGEGLRSARASRNTNPIVRRYRPRPAGVAMRDRQPACGQHSTAAQATRTQALLARPQRIARRGVDQMHVREVDAGLPPAGGIGQVGRGDDGDVVAGLRQSRQRRQQQAQFADAVGRQQQFGQRCFGPAAPGQHRIQRRMAGGLCRRRQRGGGPAAPDAAVGQQCVEGNDGLGQRPRQPSLINPQYTPSMAKSWPGPTSIAA